MSGVSLGINGPLVGGIPPSVSETQRSVHSDILSKHRAISTAARTKYTPSHAFAPTCVQLKLKTIDRRECQMWSRASISSATKIINGIVLKKNRCKSVGSRLGREYVESCVELLQPRTTTARPRTHTPFNVEDLRLAAAYQQSKASQERRP